MYRSMQDFLDDWEAESQLTINLFKSLTNESLYQKIVEDGRNLGFLAWHITATISETLNKTGLKIPGPLEDSDPPNNVEDIIKTYQTSSDALIEEVGTKLDDKSLDDELELYGERWKRHQVFDMLIKHQIHHRGQMTVLMRQAGLKLPGIYGPSKDDWIAMGATPLK
ncbi:MAG: DinB family protein [Candidatus Kapabacteria bacterium]|nr:DinB family protein [Candidatus Kapabacteria bacterium]